MVLINFHQKAHAQGLLYQNMRCLVFYFVLRQAPFCKECRLKKNTWFPVLSRMELLWSQSQLVRQSVGRLANQVITLISTTVNNEHDEKERPRENQKLHQTGGWAWEKEIYRGSQCNKYLISDGRWSVKQSLTHLPTLISFRALLLFINHLNSNQAFLKGQTRQLIA